MVVGHHGLAPSEYWQMTPSEVWLYIDAKTPEPRYGNLRESQLDELFDVYEKGDFA